MNLVTAMTSANMGIWISGKLGTSLTYTEKSGRRRLLPWNTPATIALFPTRGRCLLSRCFKETGLAIRWTRESGMRNSVNVCWKTRLPDNGKLSRLQERQLQPVPVSSRLKQRSPQKASADALRNGSMKSELLGDQVGRDVCLLASRGLGPSCESNW